MLGNQLATWKTWLAETEWAPWLILGLAIFLRFFLLDIKPPHFDEGINGWFVDQMMKNGFYRYDPTNYHGPLHFYVLLLSDSLFGRNIWALRLPVVLVSIGCVWLCLKFEPLVGRNVSRMAALAMAVSPGFVFYGRYSIHEVWLVLFSMMFILGLLGLWKFGTTNYLWCAGMGVAGMILTKETYIIHVGLRGGGSSSRVGLPRAQSPSRRQAGQANVDLSRSFDGRWSRRRRDRLFLFRNVP